MSAQGMTILPPAADCCQVCARQHPPELPHDPQSLYWATVRVAEGKPEPTWADAMAHCTPEMRAEWSERLTLRGVHIGAVSA